MTDILIRPERPEPSAAAASSPDSLAERLLDTLSPQRPQSTPRIRIEVDGRVVDVAESARDERIAMLLVRRRTHRECGLRPDRDEQPRVRRLDERLRRRRAADRGAPRPTHPPLPHARVPGSSYRLRQSLAALEGRLDEARRAVTPA